MTNTVCTKSVRFYRRLSEVLFESDLVGVRFSLFLGELFWSIALLWPGETMSRPTYNIMNNVGNDTMWALVFGISATTQFTILMLNDYKSMFVRYFTAWNAMLWLFACVSALLSVYPPPAAMGGELALALGATWIWLRPFIIKHGENMYVYRGEDCS